MIFWPKKQMTTGLMFGLTTSSKAVVDSVAASKV